MPHRSRCFSNAVFATAVLMFMAAFFGGSVGAAFASTNAVAVETKIVAEPAQVPLACPAGARRSTVSRVANETIECAMEVVPGLGAFLPTLGAAVETHPVATGPVDLTCHRGSYDEAKMLWCDRQYTRRQVVRHLLAAQRIDQRTTLDELRSKLPSAVRSLMRVCRAAEDSDWKWHKLAACAGMAPALPAGGAGDAATWTSAARQDHHVFCSLAGACGAEGFDALCAAVVRPLERQLKTCVGPYRRRRLQCIRGETGTKASRTTEADFVSPVERVERLRSHDPPLQVWVDAVAETLQRSRVRAAAQLMGEDVELCGTGTHVVVVVEDHGPSSASMSPAGDEPKNEASADAAAMLRFSKKYQPHSTIDAGAESRYKQCLLASAREMLGRCEADADATEEVRDVQRARRRLGNRPGFSTQWAGGAKHRREPESEDGDDEGLPWHTDIFTV